MKKTFTLIIFFFLGYHLHAQKIKFNDDTAYVDEKPFCIVSKTKGFTPDYSIKTLAGEEFLFAGFSYQDQTTKRTYYELTFLGSGRKVETETTLSFAKFLARETFQHKLILDGKFNPEGEERFMKIYGNSIKRSSANNSARNNGADYEMVTRNRSGMIMCIGGTVKQSNIEIGTYKSDQNASGGIIIYTTEFYLPNGTKVAKAILEGMNAKTVNIFTNKDSQTHTISIEWFNRRENDVAKWLVENNYL